ncbi:hypothetical protein NP493_40g03003 [Ridgeia piscesae]|uniref:PHD-type domain-containing protein n=1 Tax=Ridgeia piscesae TaxID=27915 RepID=A0AAD9UJY9_RIDPI|nr:hypothetical protein NP493_40g03003 [Ridgeia piscesae]
MLGQCHDEDRFGGFILDEVQAEITRGRLLKCYVCKNAGDTAKDQQNGATCGCAISKCNATFHYPCAKESAITARLLNKKTCNIQYVYVSSLHLIITQISGSQPNIGSPNHS